MTHPYRNVQPATRGKEPEPSAGRASEWNAGDVEPKPKCLKALAATLMDSSIYTLQRKAIMVKGT